MAKNKHLTIPYRRKLQRKTDYKLRKSLLSSSSPRLVVRKSLKNISAQIIMYGEKGDKVIATATTSELKKLGWHGKNLPSAYLVGLLIGKKALKQKLSKAILDTGLARTTKGSKIYAVLKGALDSGMEIPHSKEILPSDERLEGRHIIDYHSSEEKLKKHPSASNHIELQKKFQEVKSKII